MQLTCAIIDDEPLARELLESYVDKTPFLSLQGSYASATEAWGKISTQPVDVIFLDIQMPELSGLEFSKVVPVNTRIIFTTAFSQYALDGYKVNALDYLLKPVSYSDFLAAAQKAYSWFEKTTQAAPTEDVGETISEQADSFFVKSDYKLVRVLTDIETVGVTLVKGIEQAVGGAALRVHTQCGDCPIGRQCRSGDTHFLEPFGTGGIPSPWNGVGRSASL